MAIPTITWGSGRPVIFIHGSNAVDPINTWAAQRPLAECYQLRLLARRGYGTSPPRSVISFDLDVQDTIDALATGGHLVGFSYGGVVALLVAGQRPDLIHSLTVIEPPAFSVVRGDPAVEALITRLQPVFGAVPHVQPERWWTQFLRACGLTPRLPLHLSPAQEHAVRATMYEPPPWEALILLDVLAAAHFPKLVVAGGERAPSLLDTATRVAGNELAERIHADYVTFGEAGHAVHRIGQPFNERLDAMWRGVQP